MTTAVHLASAHGATVAEVEAVVADAVADLAEAELDYVALVDAATLEPAPVIDGEQRLLVAARFGSTRLLDNLAVVTPPA
jgi:pantoate--beta-alanine ligase